jgi:hypothetical protein
MRSAISISVSATDRRRLEAIVADRSAPQKHVWRARIEAVEFATLEWVDWFNNRRNIPPAEAEARFYAQSAELAMVA